MTQERNTTVVMLVAESFGLSTAWQGNILASSKSENFSRLWLKYPRVLLNEPTFFDDKINFATLGTGHKVSTDSEFITKEIKEKRFLSNQQIDKIFENSRKNNSAVHFIGSLSGKYGNIEHLLELVKFAKKSMIFRVYVHLILDNSSAKETRDILPIINNLSESLSSIGVGEIASICGENLITDQSSFQNFTKTMKSIVKGEGLKALTPEQGLINKRNNQRDISQTLPISIFRNGRPIAKISSFDSVVFYNFDNKSFSKAIILMSQKNPDANSSMPNFLSVFDTFQFIEDSHINLTHLFERNFNNTFPSLLAENNIKELFISDNLRKTHIQQYLCNIEGDNIDYAFYSTPEEINSQYFNNFENFLNNTYLNCEKSLKERKYNFIFIDLPTLYMALRYGDFSLAVKTSQLIDLFLGKLSTLTLTKNSALIFTSINNVSLISKNALLSPFLFILPEYRKPSALNNSFNNQLVYDFLHKKYDIMDIAPTILDLFGINRPESFTGESLLDQKKLILN